MTAHLAKFFGFAFLLAVSPLHGQTLNWSSLTGSTINDSQGDPLNNSYVFQLGTFGNNFVPTESNLPQWLANWQVFDTAAYSNNSTDLGFFTGTQNVQDVPQYASLFEGLKAYVFIYDAANTEYFLATTSSDAWKFPVHDPGCCPTGEVTWSISDLGTDTPLWGGQGDKDGPGEHDDPGPYDIQTHVVPEMTSSLLSLLGCAIFALRRRRQPC